MTAARGRTVGIVGIGTFEKAHGRIADCGGNCYALLLLFRLRTNFVD